MSLISNLQFTGSARTTIPLANFTNNLIMDVGAYDAGEIAGWFYIRATTSYRFWFSAKFAKNGEGTDYWVSPSTMGDAPPAGFNMSIEPSGLVRAFIPNIAGYISGAVTYALDAPAVGAEYPLLIDGSNFSAASATLSGAVSTTDQTFAGVKTFQNPPVIPNASGIAAASESAPGIVTTGAQTLAGAKSLSSALAIVPTANQLVLGATRTVTVNAPTPATASRIHTIPDVGADASFVMDQGAQAIAGVKTFSSAPVFSAGISGISTTPAANTIGEVRSFTARSVQTTTSNTWATNASVLDTLPAGVWLVLGQATITNLTNMTAAATGISNSTAAGAPALGAANWIGYNPPAAATGGDTRQMVAFRIVVPAGTTQALYAKAITVGAVGTVCTVSGFSIRIA